MKKGYAIILDSIVALTFTLVIVASLIGMRQSGSSLSDLSLRRLHYVSEDTLDVLNKKGVLDEVGEALVVLSAKERNVSDALRVLLAPLVTREADQ